MDKRNAVAWAIAILLLAVAAPSLADERKASDVFRYCKACPKMVVIPACAYVMGEDKRHRYEKPAHKVTIAKAFAIGKYELAFDEWEVCHADGGCKKNPDDHKWGRGRRPIMNISWFGAQEYLAWISKRTGHTYRFPTEAEWEYAARAGTRTAYSWGDDEPGTTNANCRTCAPHISHQSYPVGKCEPNPWGLFDIHCNVWEWVEDCWNKTHAGAPADGSARTDGKCRYRVTRSGSWYYVSTNARSGYRAKFIARAYSYGIGLRPVRELP
jgi:formylglycine-generating enzyme required for sulfatase activity